MTVREPRDPARYSTWDGIPRLKNNRRPGVPPGLRIRHIKLRSCLHVIPHPGDPLTGRAAKDYHILLDANGENIVSPKIWERIQQTTARHDYLIVNEVHNPPPITIGMGFDKDHPVVRQHTEQRQYANRQVGAIIEEMTPPGVRPRVTLHQVPPTTGAAANGE